MRDRHIDILIYDAAGRPYAAIEVKNLPLLSLTQARALRDSLRRALAAPLPYLLVVAQDASFIWAYDPGANAYGEAEPIDMRPVLEAYRSIAGPDARLRGVDLELILSTWLAEVAQFLTEFQPRIPGGEVFQRFVTGLRGARVSLEAAA